MKPDKAVAAEGETETATEKEDEAENEAMVKQLAELKAEEVADLRRWGVATYSQVFWMDMSW